MALKEAFGHIYFSPSKTVTFTTSPRRQKEDLTITNYSDHEIMFKMKSTHPRLFRMRPVYGIISPQREVSKPSVVPVL
ncbi:hypothetical protein COOONC_03048 [Cooperia oncophora]